MSGSSDTAALAAEIASAFPAVEPPAPPVTTGAGPVQDDVEQALAGKRAEELTPSDARAVRLDLWSLTPAAWQYYAPALLRMFLADPDDDELDGLGEGIFDTLVPPDDAELRERFDERMARLGDAQRAALRAFVCWYREQEPELAGADAAARHWGCD